MTSDDKWTQEMPTFEVYDNLKPSGTYKHQYHLEDNKVIEIKEITVFTFLMGDVEDPDLMAGAPLCDWQESEMGKWVLKHAVETPMWHRLVDHATFGHRYVIKAKLKAKDITFFHLKWRDYIDKPIRR